MDVKENRFGRASALFAVLNFGIMAFLTCVFIFSRGYYIQAYSDLLGADATLPKATELVLTFPGALVIAGLLVVTVVLAVKELIPNKLIPLLINAVCLIAVIAVSTAVSIVLNLPLVKLTEVISAG